MLPEYTQQDFSGQPLQCGSCRWQGTGADALIIDFYGVSRNQEAHCPNCDAKLAVVVKGNNDDPPGETATDLGFQIG